MADSRPANAFETAPGGAALAYLALAIAFGPVWPDWLSHALGAPWAHASLVFGILLGLRAWTSRNEIEAPLAPRLGGAIALAAALGAMLLVGAGLPRFARLALPIGILGLAARHGRPPLRIALLSLWLVPLPSFALGLASPGLEQLWLQVAALLAPDGSGLGFALEPVDAGLGLAWILAGLGYHTGLRARARPNPIAFAALAAGFAPLLQIAALALALRVSADGGTRAAQQLLREGPWLVAVIAGLSLPERIRSLRRAATSGG